MKLQILIPQYKETDETVKPLLDSIAIQQNVNFNELSVIICNDGSDVFLSDELLKSYPYRIDYYKEEHNGVSATRNACLDKATADYVMFCDADDMFCHACGLWYIFKKIKEKFDTMTSVFIEESRFKKDEPDYILRENDSTFVHGKVHRRQYLIDNNIRWNNNLTIHEDSYFNILCQSLTKKFIYTDTPFYLWKWRDESVCRHDPKYILKTYNNMLDSNDTLIDQFLNRNKKQEAIFYASTMILDAYYTMNKPEWIDQKNQEYRRNTELRFKDYFLKHEALWKKMKKTDKMLISNSIRQNSVFEGMQMESITITDWLKHIKELN